MHQPIPVVERVTITLDGFLLGAVIVVAAPSLGRLELSDPAAASTMWMSGAGCLMGDAGGGGDLLPGEGGGDGDSEACGSIGTFPLLEWTWMSTALGKSGGTARVATRSVGGDVVRGYTVLALKAARGSCPPWEISKSGVVSLEEASMVMESKATGTAACAGVGGGGGVGSGVGEAERGE